jgi:large subunit ribosomal protein L23
MNKERIFKVLLAPHITEKASVVGDAGNQVVFKVAVTATKRDVKAAVEALFEVKVVDVRLLNVKGKTKRTKNGLGKCSDWKKAYVNLAADQDIDFMAIG